MAAEKVVGPCAPLFGAVRDLVRQLQRSLGPMYFAALVRLRERPDDEWALLLGSLTLTRDPQQGLKAVVKAMNARLPGELARAIRRVSILKADDPFFLTVSQIVRCESIGGIIEFRDCNLGGVEVGHLAVFVAAREMPKVRRSPKTKPRAVRQSKGAGVKRRRRASA